MGNVKKITVRVGTAEKVITGRAAWALHNLIHAGPSGCTPIDHPGPRWSDYVFKLRKRGFPVETIDEKHGGTYRGTHARYVLTAPVEIVEVESAA